MPTRVRTVFVSVALAAAILGTTSPALAERPITGAEAQRFLAGKQFLIQCVDGTHGYGVFNTHGIVSVAYRRFNARNDQRDHATVRARGNEICLSWKEFDGDGCYPVSEKKSGHFRIGSTMRWCEIKTTSQ